MNIMTKQIKNMANLFPADHDYCRFQIILFIDQITAIGNGMCVFLNIKICKYLISHKTNMNTFQTLELWIAVARHNSSGWKFK